MFRITLLLILLSVFSCGKTPLYGPLESDDNVSTRGSRNAQSDRATDELVWTDDRQHFAFQWHSIPAVGIDAKFNIKFWDSYQTNFLGPYNYLPQNLCVFLWMKMPDGSEHGSSPLVLSQVSDASGDYYSAKDVYFIMPGIWQIRVRTVSNLNQCNGLKSDPYLEEKIFEIFVK
jgi:hypothetical protein